MDAPARTRTTALIRAVLKSMMHPSQSPEKRAWASQALERHMANESARATLHAPGRFLRDLQRFNGIENEG